MPSRSVPSPLSGWRAGFAAGLLAVFAAETGAAHTLEVPPGEDAAIKSCEKKICAMILGKESAGDDLACDLQKTWAQSSLEGGKSKGMSWGFGDARCTVDVALSRADIIAALTQSKHTVRVPAHDVSCVVVREGEERPVAMTVAPKLKFKHGKADKVWINLEKIEGPVDVRATVWTAAQLEDTLGVFHRPLIRSINRFIHRRCEQRWGPDGTETKAEQEEAAKKLKAAATVIPPPKRKEAPPAKAAAAQSSR
ncbi:hypothetical protein W911_11455 [Hyphomicrobium nitrativorans NL23]|uniref:Uncharacterized protein n=1 Tax=Hyphomicrobium nitrativorans NL23 TaxID=1029756 RepID=V5SJR9_9HYPH|nr:hypothetical protein [Hyphomicrobium nitrativorans]AHB50219.1 hypothetical protein W911_11455 [Hyphomicrobium nitrativorans NL23]